MLQRVPQIANRSILNKTIKRSHIDFEESGVLVELHLPLGTR
jgi:hypothetical protein